MDGAAIEAEETLVADERRNQHRQARLRYMEVRDDVRYDAESIPGADEEFRAPLSAREITPGVRG